MLVASDSRDEQRANLIQKIAWEAIAALLSDKPICMSVKIKGVLLVTSLDSSQNIVEYYWICPEQFDASTVDILLNVNTNMNMILACTQGIIEIKIAVLGRVIRQIKCPILPYHHVNLRPCTRRAPLWEQGFRKQRERERGESVWTVWTHWR